MSDDKTMRSFDTGATRDTAEGKLDMEGFTHPMVMRQFAKYMNMNRLQSDGQLRDSDNWQKGIPIDAYMKSLKRHCDEVWLNHRGFGFPREAGIKAALCGIMFNSMGMLLEVLKADTWKLQDFDGDEPTPEMKKRQEGVSRDEDLAQNEEHEQKLLPECIPVPATTIELGDFRHTPCHLTMPHTDIESTMKMIEDAFIQPIILGYEEFMKKAMVAPGHTGFCMGDFDPLKCHDCFTLDDCVAMGDREREEKLEELIDVPELPVCFGKCGAEGGSFELCGDCNDKEECDTLVCSDDCDFRIECRDDFVRPDDDSTFLDDMMEDVESCCPTTQEETNEEPLVHDTDTKNCLTCNFTTVLWKEYPCRSCLRNDSMNPASICPLDYWKEEE